MFEKKPEDKEIKVSCEIKDGEFHYSYKIGKGSSASGSMPLSEESLCAFTKVLELISRSFWHDQREKDRQISSLAYIETHLEECEKFIEQYKKNHKK